MGVQPIRQLVNGLFHGNKILFRCAVTIVDDLQDMVRLRKQCYRIGKRPFRLRCTRQKQKRLSRPCPCSRIFIRFSASRRLSRYFTLSSMFFPDAFVS